MDGHSDWDLSAVVRGYTNSSTQDVHDHFNGDFSSQPCDSIPSLQRCYFGLEEVIDCFTNGNGKKREPPLTSRPRSLDKADGSGDTGKDTRATKSTIPPPTSKPQQPLPSPQIGSPKKGGGLEDEKPHSRVKEVTVVEVPVEKVDEWDGWVWRKYGKKRVCDSPYSKSYYRCSHEGNKCPAKKHVQQSQKDESKYIITYRGNHIHPPSVQSNATKRRKRSRAPAPPAGKEECSFSPPTTNAS